MGATGGPGGADRRRRLFLAVPLAVLTLLALGQGAARAVTCDTAWSNPVDGQWSDAANWSHGVPTAGQNACITVNGTYDVSLTGQEVQVNSLVLGGGSGTQTLSIIGAAGAQASLALAAGGSISPQGDVELTENCAANGCVALPAASLINASTSTPLVNAGTINAAAGPNGDASNRELAGNVTNMGTIDLGTTLTYAVPEVMNGVGTLDNRGTISLHNRALVLLFDPVDLTTPVVDNDTGGLITNGGSTGSVRVQARGKYIQGGGVTSPAAGNPAHPAVLFDDTSFTDPLPTLSYTGGGASAVEVRGGANLIGNITAGQSLNISGIGPCSGESLVTAAAGFTNAGTITLGGPCDSGLAIATGTLGNQGTLVAASTGTGKTRELKGSLTNSGSFQVAGAIAFDKSGATLRQTAGSTTMGAGAQLDPSSSGATFRLQGGVLSGGGGTRATAAVINGSVSNTGGNVIPGRVRVPGLMSFDGSYSQGSGGKLTELIDGTSVGSGYSQLSAGGNMTIGGTLAIHTLSGPAVGKLYTAVGSQGTRIGRFSHITGLFKPEGPFPPGWTVGYKLDYQFPDAVALDAEAAAGLRIKRAGTGTGTVISSPAGISCGSHCDAPFFRTQTVTLTAHPASGSSFAGWSGACTGRVRTCRVKMRGARTVTAKFSH